MERRKKRKEEEEKEEGDEENGFANFRFLPWDSFAHILILKLQL
jgi:hypothetical protein